MKKFIARKKIKVPRYKIYYFLLACSVFFVFILNIFVSLVLKSDMGNTFLQLLASNSWEVSLILGIMQVMYIKMLLVWISKKKKR